MSAYEPPELRAYRELESLVRHLGEELAVFRRRALTAEAKLAEPATGGGARGGREHARERGVSAGNVVDLETENHALRARIDRAEERVRQLMERVRFLRQQVQLQAPVVGTARQSA